MLWSLVLPEVHHYARLDRHPDVLLLHVGGNDLGLHSMLELIRNIKFDFLCLRSLFPDTILIWSDIVGRSFWCMTRSVERLNKARIKVKREVIRFFCVQWWPGGSPFGVGARYMAFSER